MRPLKGMIRDVHPSKMPDGAYVDAVNFVYGEHMDALMQEAGFSGETYVRDDVITSIRIVGGVGLVDEGVLLFGTNPQQTTSYVIRVIGSSVEILSSGDFGFNADAVIDATAFKTTNGDTFVIFTDDLNPPKYLNVDDSAVPNLINPTHTPIYIEEDRDVSGGQGFFSAGTHYLAVAYSYEDGSTLEFNNLNGPYVRYDEGGNVSLQLSNLDPNFSFVTVAFVSVYHDAVETGIAGQFNYTGTTAKFTVTGLKTGEISLDELLVQNPVYTRAKTLPMQGNRLYLGNVRTGSADDLQEHANRVQVLYQTYYGGHDEDGLSAVAFNGDDGESDLGFGGLCFQPGEVYAFYVAYVRSDGSMSPAFHIPGPPPRTIGQPHVTAAESAGGITETDSALITAAGGSLDYLQDDNSIATGMRYYHTRNTHEYFGASSAYTPSGVTSGVGICGVWENAGETYPLDFPVQKWTVEDTADNSGSITEYTLAGAKVRHHKIPVPTSSSLDHGNKAMVRIRFANVPKPEGYVGVRFFYAQRDLTNSLHIGQSILLHGSANYYAQNAETEAVGYYEYASSAGMNLPQLNHTAVMGTNPNVVSPLSSDTDQLSDSQFYAGLKEDTGRMYCFEAMGSRVNLPETAYIENVDLRVTYGLGSTADTNIGNGLVTDTADLNYFGDSDILNVPNAYTVGGRRFVLDTGRQVNVTDNARIRKVSTVRYVESNAIDDTLEFDNRFQNACIGFNIDHANNTRRDAWRTVLKDTAVTYDGLTSNPGLGFMMDSSLSSAYSTTVANPLWVTNLKQHLFNCYPNFADQTLASCTGVIPFTLLATPELGQVAGESTDVGSVDTSFVVGDIVRSVYKHRVTAPVGVDRIQTVNGQEGATTLLLAPVTTIDFQRGFLAHTYEYFVQGKTKHRYFDYVPEHETNLSNADYVFYRDASPENDTDYEFPVKFFSENVYQPPGVFSAGKTFIDDFPHRVVRSSEISDLGVSTNVIAFRPVEFFDMQRDRGEIENLQGYGDRLIIHHERGLFLTQGQEKIATTAGNLALGQADIFATKPVEIRPSDKGYAGTQHLQGCILTPHGYFFTDVQQGKVFNLAGTELQEISRNGMKDWFVDKLRLNPLYTTKNLVTFSPGVMAVYDNRYDRVVLHIRNNNSTVAQTLPTNHDDYNASTALDADDTFISYSYLNKGWVSRHTYDSTLLLAGVDEVYSVRVAEITDPLPPYGNLLQPRMAVMHAQERTFGQYHGTPQASTIDVSFPAGGAAVYQSFDWNTRVVTFPDERYTHYQRTFTKAMVYTDTHCSGLVTLVTPNGLSYNHNLRHVHDKWYFNGFRDVVNDRTLPFLDADLELIETNIDNTQNWYNRRRMQSDYAVVRLFVQGAESGDNGIGLYLYDVNAKARATPRG